MVSRATILPSKRDDHRTPDRVLEPVEKFFGGVIELDPCASSNPPHWFALENYPKELDGLSRPWKGKTYVNPPFGRVLDKWIRKARKENHERGTEIILLHPAFTGRIIWQTTVCLCDAMCFWKGRIAFVGSKHGAAFNCQLTYYGKRPREFRDAFRKYGRIWIPAKES